MKTLATDLDGTLYLDDVLIKGVESAYKSLILDNYKIFHTTNNSSQSTDVLAKKLSNLLNVDIDLSSIVTPLVVLKEYLSNKKLSIFVYGSKDVKDFVSSISNTVTKLEDSNFIIMNPNMWYGKNSIIISTNLARRQLGGFLYLHLLFCFRVN